MKVLAMVGAAGGILFGMGGVWMLSRTTEPRTPRDEATHEQRSFTPSSSTRSPIGASLAPTEGATEGRAARGVDVHWAKLNKQGIEALEAGEHARAVKLFEQCRGGVPSEPIFTQNLAEALSRLAATQVERGGADEQQKALASLERAVELAPSREDLVQRLADLRRKLAFEHDLWTDVTDHFELAYDGQRTDLLGRWHEITSMLESAYEDYGSWFAFHPVEAGRPKIRVVLYKEDQFHEQTGVGHWAGGMYDGTVRVPVEDLKHEKERFKRTLRHELMHAFVHELGGRDVPGWLNEGLAQRFENGDAVLDASVVDVARRNLGGKTLVPLEELRKSLSTMQETQKLQTAYTQSLAFVGWLERQYGEALVRELVKGCKQGVAVEDGFRSATNLELATTFEDFAQSL